jgi:predicted NUDIX family phosphoesterase
LTKSSSRPYRLALEDLDRIRVAPPPREAPPGRGLDRPHRSMEFVFVVPRAALFPECYPHGLVAFSDVARPGSPGAPGLSAAAFEQVIAREGFFVERAYAEKTPTLKQIIPYTIVCCDTELGLRVLCTRRLARGGEARLHDKHSIGIGGHINPEDLEGTTHRNPLDAGTRREIHEELVVRGPFDVRRVGILNDDSNPVGAVHVGVVQVAKLSGPVDIREKDQLEGRLVSIEDLHRMLTEGVNFETWSKLLVPHADELIPQPLAAHS